MPDNEIMTVKELAGYSKIAEKTAYRFAAEGKVPSFKVGNAWRFHKDDLEAWINNQKIKSGNLQ
ncbi:MAG: helix-turn-helix domain-containing protein [Alphaproteobacteria bacterium]|nr:helix-turn-helix domain-containing protein [Alphaproteobacteria bacterium]